MPSLHGGLLAKLVKCLAGAVPRYWDNGGGTKRVTLHRETTASTTRSSVTAIENAGPHPDREKVKDVMNARHDQPTIIGNHSWTMDARRNPHYGAALLVVKDGKFALAPQ